MNRKQASSPIYIILILAALALLTGCSPVYEIHYKYSPPTDQAGRSCIQGCQADRNACMNDCDAKKLVCLEDAPAKAQDMLLPREKEYMHSLEAYVSEKDNYELKLERWKSEREYLQDQYDLLKEQCKKYPNEKSYCSDKKSKSFELTRHGWRKPSKSPKAPEKPSYATGLKHQQEECEDDCSCNTRYDGCYTSCGGQIDPQRICVENCE